MFKAIADVYLSRYQWPGWAWLEETMDRQGLDALVLWRSVPREYTHQYGYTWPAHTNPQPSTRVGLTIAGLSQVDAARPLVAGFVHLVSTLGRLRSNVMLDPSSETRPVFSREEVTSRLHLMNDAQERSIIDLLGHEPATWLCSVNHVDQPWSSVELSPSVRRFAGVTDVNEYLIRLGEIIQPPIAEPVLVYTSPFALPAAIDYLDVTWMRRFGKPLVTAPGIERSARLASMANSASDADSCLSALAEVLKGLQVPGQPGIDGHPLQRLVPFLNSELPPETHNRLAGAVTVLQAARQLRASAQHIGAQPRAVSAYTTLGLNYPVTDWSAAWLHIQVVVAGAFDAIREELQAAKPYDA